MAGIRLRRCVTGQTVSDRRWGAIGVDINPDQLVLAEVDGSGNFVGGEHILCITYGKRQDQVKAILGEIAKQVMAVGCGKPIVLERLQFEKKKATLEDKGSERARLLSGFAYQQTKQCLKAAAFRAGVEVIEVNPAYTSTIGAVNYAHRYEISVHQGAAIAIARRSLALSERPAKRVAQVPTHGGDHVTLLLPERNRSKHVWSLWSKVSRQTRAALAAHPRLLRRSGRSTPPAWSYQPPCAT
jgi:IS605 OrfB family transposase